MPIDDTTYRRNSRSTQTEHTTNARDNSAPDTRTSLFSSVINFVTNATTTASLEFDRLCESIGLVNKGDESEYEYVTDESGEEVEVTEEDEKEESRHYPYVSRSYNLHDDSEVDELEITTSSASKGIHPSWSSTIAKTTQTFVHSREPRRWTPPRTTSINKKEESSSEEEQWKPPDVMAQVRRINEKLKQTGVYDFKPPLPESHSPLPVSSSQRKIAPYAIKLESPIKPIPKADSQASVVSHSKDVVNIIKSEPTERILPSNDHASQTNVAPEQSSRRVTFASPDRTENEQTSDTPSSQLHLYNLQLERDLVERLERELATVKAKVETLTSLSPKIDKEETFLIQDSQEKPPEDALPSPSTSPSRPHTEDNRNKRYSPILGRPTPLTHVLANSVIYENINLKPINTPHVEIRDTGVRQPNPEMRKILSQIPAVKLRQANLIKQPDGTYIVNRFWNEIYNRKDAQLSNHAQATPAESQDKSSKFTNATAQQTDLPTNPTPSKRKVFGHDDNMIQHEHSNAKVAKLS